MPAKYSRLQAAPQRSQTHVAQEVNCMFALGEFTAVYVKGEKTF